MSITKGPINYGWFVPRRGLHLNSNEATNLIKGGINNVTRSLQEIPKSTGAGPFAESTRFEILGSPSSILNVTLPSSSILNMRNASIIACNGKMDGISTKVNIIKHLTPIIYQRITTAAPVNFLVSSNNKFKNLESFVNIEIDSNEKWVIKNKNHLVAWSGYNFNIESNSVRLNGGFLTLNNFNSLKTAGQGQLVLSGLGQLLTVKLNDDEKLLINPNSLIAHNGSSDVVFRNVQSSKFNFNLPQFSKFNEYKIPIKNYLEVLLAKLKVQVGQLTQKSEEESQRVLQNEKAPEIQTPTKEGSKVLSFLSRSLTHLNTAVKNKLNKYFKNEIYYEVKGPVTLLVQSQVGNYNNIFTDEELTKIYESIKQASTRIEK